MINDDETCCPPPEEGLDHGLNLRVNLKTSAPNPLPYTTQNLLQVHKRPGRKPKRKKEVGALSYLNASAPLAACCFQELYTPLHSQRSEGARLCQLRLCCCAGARPKRCRAISPLVPRSVLAHQRTDRPNKTHNAAEEGSYDTFKRIRRRRCCRRIRGRRSRLRSGGLCGKPYRWWGVWCPNGCCCRRDRF